MGGTTYGLQPHMVFNHQTGKRGSFFRDSGHGEGIVMKVATACFSL